MSTLGIYSTLQQARQEKGLTQQELGKLLQLPQGYISQVEKGKRDIKTNTLMDWAKVLDLELMLIPRTQASAIAYLIKAGLTTAQHPPSAYGALPDEVASDE